MKVTKEKQKTFLKQQLSSRKNWALRALIKIWEYQTEEEKMVGRTMDYNGVGFSGVDSEILSSFAEQYLQKGYLSKKQMKYVYKLIPKYWGQVLEISDKEKLNKQIVENG